MHIFTNTILKYWKRNIENNEMKKLLMDPLQSTVEMNMLKPLKQWLHNAVSLYTVHRVLCFLAEIKLPN